MDGFNFLNQNLDLCLFSLILRYVIIVIKPLSLGLCWNPCTWLRPGFQHSVGDSLNKGLLRLIQSWATFHLCRSSVILITGPQSWAWTDSMLGIVNTWVYGATSQKNPVSPRQSAAITSFGWQQQAMCMMCQSAGVKQLTSGDRFCS